MYTRADALAGCPWSHSLQTHASASAVKLTHSWSLSRSETTYNSWVLEMDAVWASEGWFPWSSEGSLLPAKGFLVSLVLSLEMGLPESWEEISRLTSWLRPRHVYMLRICTHTIYLPSVVPIIKRRRAYLSQTGVGPVLLGIAVLGWTQWGVLGMVLPSLWCASQRLSLHHEAWLVFCHWVCPWGGSEDWCSVLGSTDLLGAKLWPSLCVKS